MTDLIKLKLLLKNPLIDNYSVTPWHNSYINECLGYTFTLPEKASSTTNNLPFIFSCFALSLDGKLHYPDNLSGFSIASANHHATNDERIADLHYLMLARSISDAIIIGATSLKQEKSSYTPNITIPELSNLDDNQSRFTIIICRNLNSLDLSQELFKNPDFPIMICCFEAIDHISRDGYTSHKLSELKSRNQLSIKNIITLDADTKTLCQKLKLLGFNIILNESPFFQHSLLEHKLLDEIWLNYSCSYIGGSITSLGNKQNSFTSTNHPDTEILTLHHLDYHFLYSRQRVLYYQ